MTMSFDINSPEAKEAIAAAVEEATAGLASKNKELLGEIKKLKRGQEIDPAEHQRLQDELEEARSKLANADKAVKQAQAEAEKSRKAAEAESGYVSKLLVDNGLTEALTKAGVTNPIHLKAAKAMLTGTVQLKADGDTRAAVVGDKPLADFITEWAKGDEGKHFVAAPANSGGGSQGGGSGAGGQKTMSRADFDRADQATRVAFAKDGGKVVD